MFAGISFSGDGSNLSYVTGSISNITYLESYGYICDELFGTATVGLSFLESEKSWDYETIFYALFQGDLFAGNVDYSASTTTSVIIKRRKYDETQWVTLFEIDIEDNSDFSFERADRYARGNTNYYYAMIPVFNETEGSMNIANIDSEFDGAFFMEKEIGYQVLLNYSLSMQKNKTTSVVTTLGNQYPYFVSNGDCNYTSGSVTCTFIQMVDCVLQYSTQVFYQEDVDSFLLDGKPKIFKTFDGRIFMINVQGNLSIDTSTNVYVPKYTISFVEVGDPMSQDDLYYNGFIDIEYGLTE